MTDIHPENPAERFRSLDGLRGIAALVVVVFHLSLLLPAGWEWHRGVAPPSGAVGATPLWWLHRTPLAILIAGRPAVFVFFVLSGFVLAYSFVESDRGRWQPFLVKRLARIWLPFAAAILLSAALQGLTDRGDVTGASGWFNGMSWTEPFSWGRLAAHLLLVGWPQDLDNVMWSLAHELRISLVFPMLVWAWRRRPVLLPIGMIAFSAICIVLAGRIPDPVAQSWIETGIFAYLFVFGIALASGRRLVAARVNALPALVMPPLWLLALAGLLYRVFVPEGHSRLQWIAGELPVGIGATLMVALAFRRGWTARLLQSQRALWLGRVSYSLYLVHLPLLLAYVHLAGTVSWPVLTLFALTVLPLAWLFHRSVERTAQRWGRRWSGVVERWLERRDAALS